MWLHELQRAFWLYIIVLHVKGVSKKCKVREYVCVVVVLINFVPPCEWKQQIEVKMRNDIQAVSVGSVDL